MKFLQVFPDPGHDIFEEEIIHPWKRKKAVDSTAFLKLKTLVRAITISRTKAVVLLPPRINEVHHLQFTGAERQLYESAKIESRATLEEAICAGIQSRTFNALSLLNQLRLICNHGLLTQHTKKHSLNTLQWLPKSIPLFSGSDLINAALQTCSMCGNSLINPTINSGMPTVEYDSQQAVQIEQVLCEQCTTVSDDQGLDLLCPQSLWTGFDSNISSAPTTPRVEMESSSKVDAMSTKVKALVADLRKYNSTEKRYNYTAPIKFARFKLTFNSVVFSYWTNTLDFVELMLKHNNLRFTRIDGDMSLSKRKQSLSDFQENNCIRIILVSITCGGAG